MFIKILFKTGITKAHLYSTRLYSEHLQHNFFSTQNSKEQFCKDGTINSLKTDVKKLSWQH